MPPDLLREKRDEKPLRSALSCLISGILFGLTVPLLLSLFVWKIRTPFPLYLVAIGIGVTVLSSILRYLCMPYFSPSVVLLNDNIYLQYGKSTYKYQFANIIECRMIPVIGKTSHYTLLRLRYNLENESAFFRMRLRERIDIGIPETIDRGKVEAILRAGGVDLVI